MWFPNIPTLNRSTGRRRSSLLSLLGNGINTTVYKTDSILASMAAHTVSLKEALTPSQSTAMFEKDGRGYSIDSEAQTSHNSTTLALKRRRTISLMSASIGALTIIYLGLIYCLPDSWDPLWANGSSSDLVYSSVIAESEEASQDYYQSDLKGTTSYDDDPTSILVPQFSTEEPTKLLMPITTRQPYDVLTAFYVNGTLPHSEDITHNTIDMVYLWVNSSSPILQDDMAIRAASEGVSVGQGKDQRFRDNGELRGAMRSAAKSFGDDLRKIHVLTGDYAFDIEEYRHLLPEAARENLERDATIEDDIVEGWTIGQVPNWLDWSNVGFTSSNQTLSSKVDWHFHSSVFRQPRDHLLETVDLEQRKQNIAQEREWRDESLPNFDSFAIESRVGWLEGLSDNYVLANDDMFMLSDMTAADFHHPLLGAVTRFDPTFTVRPLVDISLQSTEGEWGGLQYAASLIATRFPSKVRGYLHHMPKAMTKAATQEATVMWEEEMNEAATRGFRASARGIADIEMSWLTSWLQIERWREAMLWSFIVGRVGGADGMWGPDSRDAMRNVLGNVDSRGMVLVKGGKRSTLQTVANTMPLADQPKGTRYGFSSMDGHVPPRPDQPDISPNCLFSIDRCLTTGFFANPSQSHSAAAMFERMTFDYPECGDCLIKALISASGDRGMEAVLPTADQVYYPKQQAPVRWQREEPMLPLVSSWRQGDFSMANVVKVGQDVWEGKVGRSDGGVDLRDWCIKLLSRYAYVWATSHTHFALIQNLGQLTNAFYHLDMDKKLSMGCLNDNQPDGGAAGVPEAFGDWMSKRWGDVDATWERPGVEWPRSPAEELDEVYEDNEDTPGLEEVEDLENNKE